MIRRKRKQKAEKIVDCIYFQRDKRTGEFTCIFPNRQRMRCTGCKHKYGLRTTWGEKRALDKEELDAR